MDTYVPATGKLWAGDTAGSSHPGAGRVSAKATGEREAVIERERQYTGMHELIAE